MLSKVLTPLISCLFFTGSASAATIASRVPDGPINSASCLESGPPQISFPPSAYALESFQFLIAGVAGCSYQLDYGSETLYYTLEASTQAFFLNAPSTPTTFAFSLVGAQDPIFVTRDLEIDACPLPSFFNGVAGLASPSPILYTQANPQGQTFIQMPIFIAGATGCTYYFQIGSRAPIPVQITNVPTSGTTASQTFMITSPSLSSPELINEVVDVSLSTGQFGDPLVPAQLMVQSQPCNLPAFTGLSRGIQVLTGDEFPVTITGTPQCCYYVSVATSSTSSTRQQVCIEPEGSTVASVQAPDAPGSYGLFVGADTIFQLPLNTVGSIDVYSDCASANPTLDAAIYEATVDTMISPQLTSGVFGCSYSLTATGIVLDGMTVFEPTINNRSPIAIPLTLPSDVGVAEIKIGGGATPVSAQININAVDQACTVTPTFTMSNLGGFPAGLGGPVDVTGQAGCTYMAIYSAPGRPQVSYPISMMGSEDTQQVFIGTPEMPGSYSVTLVLGNALPSSPADLQTAAIFIFPTCDSQPDLALSAVDGEGSISVLAGQTYSLRLSGGRYGCSYNILVRDSGNTLWSNFFVQLPDDLASGTFHSLGAPSLPGTYTISTPGELTDPSVPLEVSPFCNMQPTLQSSLIEAVDANGVQTLNLGLTGQLGCEYTLNIGGALSPLRFPVDGESFAVFNPPVPTSGTYFYSVALANQRPVFGSLVVPFCDILFTSPLTDLRTQQPTFSVAINNNIACGAENEGVGVYFSFSTSNNRYPAVRGLVTRDVDDDANTYSWTPSQRLARVPMQITANSGSSSTQAQDVTFAENQPSDGVVPRKRQLRCEFNQDRCPIRSLSGRIGYECVDDLFTNLERCGSCNGPDCSQIPNVDVVACFDGQCIIESCQMGYFSTGEECVPE